jgi:hypothetical protein
MLAISLAVLPFSIKSHITSIGALGFPDSFSRWYNEVMAGYLLFPLFWLLLQHQYKGEVPAFSIISFTLPK